jgi:hypothetical protein
MAFNTYGADASTPFEVDDDEPTVMMDKPAETPSPSSTLVTPMNAQKTDISVTASTNPSISSVAALQSDEIKSVPQESESSVPRSVSNYGPIPDEPSQGISIIILKI